ncbi:tRNA (cytosine(34)-C(5))-methyltransferase Nsun2 [Oratosquilla oratoria]|uniref:tRNA (cytosine(34)-C(5))-methyltransferase Nsun2 n=1 Tax=Oratosquilla oratoria TaxID=337810 RepID=UPI003F759324
MRIARRGLEMLTVGGMMVYSTCSLNPLEDEAVIHRILVEASGTCELVDVTDKLPGLKFTKGLSDWTIMNRELEVIETPGDIPIKNTNLFNKHQFPPAPEDRDKFKLNRCVRILPHQQDTGGFFVALIRKTKPLPGEKIYVEKEPNSVTQLATHTQRTKQPPKKKRRQGFKEEPYFYFTKEEVIWPTIHEFYGLKEDVDLTLFLARTKDGKKRNVYFTNALVKDIVLNNEDHIKIINTGVKVLVRSDNKGAKCDFRLAQEGCQVFLPLHTQRKIEVKKEDLIVMLLNNDMELPPEISTLHADTQRACALLETGSAAFTYREGDISIDLVGWKGNKSVRAYVARNERMHHLRLLGADASKYEKNKFQLQKLTKNGKMEIDDGVEAPEEKAEDKDGDEDEMLDGNDKKTQNTIKEKENEYFEDTESIENTTQGN